MRDRTGMKLTVACLAAATAGTLAFAGGQRGVKLPPVPHPAENAPSEAKRVLGKILFFEEQLSPDDSVACGTCHVMAQGGTDPRRGRSPGQDGKFPRAGAFGDVMGSPGLMARTADGTLDPKGVFGGALQVTSRATPSPFMAAYSPALLWDGSAGDRFVDPASGATVISSGGALESQALLPLTNPVEMGHEGRTLPQIVAKLSASAPLALADRLPPDVAGALADGPSYPELFRRAFGSPDIDPSRIAMALATYERSLVPDRTDYDRWMAGDENALTAQEKRGAAALADAGCTSCHAGMAFTDGSLRATGVRPFFEDPGNGAGGFKVPTLRNAALKRSFFHDGARTTLEEALRFYRLKPIGLRTLTIDGVSVQVAPYYSEQQNNVQFVEGQDPLMADVHVSKQELTDIAAFLRGALVDPRVQDESFPFDRPVLASQRAELRPRLSGSGTPGNDGVVPRIIVTAPAFAGNTEFRVGVSGAMKGAKARLVVRQDSGAETMLPEIVLTDGTDGAAGTASYPLDGAQPGTTLHFVWRIWHPSGLSMTRVADVPVFARRTDPPAAEPAPAPAPGVDDGDAYVSASSFRVDWRARHGAHAADAIKVAARINPRGVGPDLSAGRVTIKVGGVTVLDGAAIDASGSFSEQGASGRFVPDTGSVVASITSKDLRDALPDTAEGRSGTTTVPIEVTVSDLGIAAPTAASQVAFAWKRGEAGVAGRFAFARTGTGNGTFQVDRVRAQRDFDGAVEVRVTGVIDAPGDLPLEAPEGLTVQIGDGAPMHVSKDDLVASPDGSALTVYDGGAVRSLRFDLRRRTVSLFATTELPTLADVPTATRVPLRISIGLNPAPGSPGLTFETVTDVELQ